MNDPYLRVTLIIVIIIFVIIMIVLNSLLNTLNSVSIKLKELERKIK